MHKMLMLASAVLVSASLFAQDATANVSEEKDQTVETKELAPVWPAWFAVCQWPRSADVIGLRLTIPFATSQENVTGIDLGFWGKSIYFEGFQFNVLRNNATDGAVGLQAGIYNTVGFGELAGIQVGLWNEAMAFGGLQVGLVNVVGEGRGLQVGVINRAETFSGYQVGLVNVIRDSEVPFFPLVNIGF